jgi:hypothetical protein
MGSNRAFIAISGLNQGEIVDKTKGVSTPRKKRYCWNMPWVRCENCKKEYFRQTKHGKVCPFCDAIIEPLATVISPKELKENLVKQAVDQAKVVDKFGEVLQIIGYVFIVIFSFGLLGCLLSGYWIGFLFCLIAIPLTFVFYNVFGSASRAVALYIQVKVK